MFRKLSIYTLLISFGSLVQAQVSGHVNYEKFGIEFDVPEGWIGQEGEGVFLMGSNSVPGIIVLTTHNYNTSQLKAEAQKGIMDQNGTQMMMAGEIQELGAHAIGANFSGTLEWQAANAYIIGIENQTGGKGVSIMAATTTQHYNSSYESIAKSILKSVKFTKVDRSKELMEWKEYFSHSRLTYMSSSYSSSYGDNSSYGGYSSERVIHLCSEGHFKYGSSSDFSAGSSGSSAYGYSNDAGTGKWFVEIGDAGDPILKLSFNNGEEYTYDLSYSEQKLYLNEDRYFYTKEGEYAPNCP